MTANGVLHLEQGGKVIGAAANGWFSKEWLGNGGEVKGEPTVREGLEGAQVVFIANDKALIFCKSGAVLDLTMKSSGRSVSSLKLTRIGVGVGASCVERIRGSVGRFGERGYVFLGSEVGDSSLLAWEIGSDSDDVREEILALEPSTEMEVDDEDGQSRLLNQISPHLTTISLRYIWLLDRCENGRCSCRFQARSTDREFPRSGHVRHTFGLRGYSKYGVWYCW